MNKIRVIKRSECAEISRSLGTQERSPRPSKRELVEVVGGWVADWRRRTELEARRAQEECARFRIGTAAN